MTEIAEKSKIFTEKQCEQEKINLDLHAIISKILKKTGNLNDKLKSGKEYAEDERKKYNC